MRDRESEQSLIQVNKLYGFIQERIIPAIVVLGALCVLLISPIFLGLYSLWERRRTLFNPPAPTNPDIEYYAYRPVQRFRQIALTALKLFFKITLFPLYLYARGVGMLIGLPIYPASLLFSNAGLSTIYRLFDKSSSLTEEEYDRNALGIMPEFKIKRCIVEMPNHVRLHTREFTPQTITEDVKTAPHIIYFKGNASRYDDYLEEMKNDALRLNAVVVGFHHGNFGYSGLAGADGTVNTVTPLSQAELVEQGIAQVQRLLDKGVDAHHITLHGHSLGAGIATLVAWHFQQQGIAIKIYNDRSFSSISSEASELLLPRSPITHDSSISEKMIYGLKGVAASAMKSLIKLFDWDLNAGRVITKLVTWDYAVVRHAVRLPVGRSFKILTSQPSDSDKHEVVHSNKILFIRMNGTYDIGFCNNKGQYTQKPIVEVEVNKFLDTYDCGRTNFKLRDHRQKIMDILISLGSQTEIYRVEDDGLIKYNASLHRAPEVQAARKLKKQNASTPEEKKRIQADHKFKLIPDSETADRPHMANPRFFTNRNNITAEEHFYNFVRSP